MNTIAVATHKGGAGKTVTSMALAAGLARAGARVLLVDVDPQGHSTIGLGVDVDGRVDATVRQLVEKGARQFVALPTDLPSLHVIGADIHLERAQYWLYTRPRREQFLSSLLKDSRPAFDWCVIDCPPSLGVLTEGAIHAADVVVVPCQMEARAADGLVDLLELVQTLKGDAFDRWFILRTRVDARKTSTNAAVMAALEPWHAHVLDTVVPQSEPLNQAQIARQDIYTFAPTSPGAKAYGVLVDEVRRIVADGAAVRA